MEKQIDFYPSSGNVFADLDCDRPKEMLLKAQLVSHIARTIESQNLTQIEAASILGIDQPKVSALINGKLSGFSIERLFRFLNALGQDVEISIKPQSSLTDLPATSIVN